MVVGYGFFLLARMSWLFIGWRCAFGSFSVFIIGGCFICYACLGLFQLIAEQVQKQLSERMESHVANVVKLIQWSCPEVIFTLHALVY